VSDQDHDHTTLAEFEIKDGKAQVTVIRQWRGRKCVGKIWELDLYLPFRCPASVVNALKGETLQTEARAALQDHHEPKPPAKLKWLELVMAGQYNLFFKEGTRQPRAERPKREKVVA
jgi:hypothetical protein